jgi:hypothetical protein
VDGESASTYVDARRASASENDFSRLNQIFDAIALG